MTIGSAKLVLLDTSVWIDFFRKKSPVFEEVDLLIEQNRICIARLIAAELLQGAKSTKEFNILKESPDVFHLLEETADTWNQAANLSRQLRSQGYTIGLGDCYIATLAHHYRVPIWSHDKHFEIIANHLSIERYRYMQ